MVLRFFQFFLILFFSISVHASIDGPHPKDYFKSPVKVPIKLAGNFGELRSNHFHAGLDIKTGGVEGLPIFSCAEGWVSRIKVQKRGYGKVIYIDHPNGYTTVYAHLQQFSSKIDAYIKEHQYRQKTYFIDVKLMKGELPVQQLEQIALSGNSGGSVAPHLHFEVRDTKSEHALNPLHFNFPIADTRKPIIKGIKFYAVDSTSRINDQRKSKYYKVYRNNGKYGLALGLKLHGKVALGIETIDHLNGSGNRCGVYDITLKVNGKQLYNYRVDDISFDESRYLNAHCDYATKRRSGKWIHRLHVLPNDQLSVYKTDDKRGVLDVKKGVKYEVDVLVKDVNGNSSSLRFDFVGAEKNVLSAGKKDTTVVASFKHSGFNTYRTDDFKLFHPDGSFYDDFDFKYAKIESKALPSDFHVIHSASTPIHKNATASIKVKKGATKTDKLVVVRIAGKRKSYFAGNFINDWMNFKLRYYGKYVLSYDTIAPKIKSLNFWNNSPLNSKSSLQLKISDDKTGIDYIHGTINGKWALFEYDYKTGIIEHFLVKSQLKKGKNFLVLVIEDEVGNRSEQQWDLIIE